MQFLSILFILDGQTLRNGGQRRVRQMFNFAYGVTSRVAQRSYIIVTTGRTRRCDGSSRRAWKATPCARACLLPKGYHSLRSRQAMNEPEAPLAWCAVRLSAIKSINGRHAHPVCSNRNHSPCWQSNGLSESLDNLLTPYGLYPENERLPE